MEEDESGGGVVVLVGSGGGVEGASEVEREKGCSLTEEVEGLVWSLVKGGSLSLARRGREGEGEGRAPMEDDNEVWEVSGGREVPEEE